jgi:hypothetical protein
LSVHILLFDGSGSAAALAATTGRIIQTIRFEPYDDVVSFQTWEESLAFGTYDDEISFTPYDEIIAFQQYDDEVRF